jgi:hypothetical protein
MTDSVAIRNRPWFAEPEPSEYVADPVPAAPFVYGVNGHDDLPTGGQEISPLADVKTPRRRT